MLSYNFNKSSGRTSLHAEKVQTEFRQGG